MPINLPGSASNSIKLDAVGTVITGKVLAVKTVRAPDLNTGVLRDVAIVTLEVAGEERTLWVEKPRLGQAIKDAALAAGVSELEGCTLTVKRDVDGVQTKAGLSAPHTFKARVEKGTIETVEDPF